MSQIDRRREHLIETYRKKAKHYDITSRLYPVPGYPQRGQRLRTVQALGLRAGDTVVDVACGTGLNFPMLEKAIGPGGRIIGRSDRFAAYPTEDPIAPQDLAASLQVRA